VTILSGGPPLIVSLRLVRLAASPKPSERACARTLSLKPNSPVPNNATFLKKFRRELPMILSPESCSDAFDSREWKWIRTFYERSDATFWFYVAEGGIRREGLVRWRAMRNFGENFQEKRPKMCPSRNSGLWLHPKMFRWLVIRETRQDSISQRLRRPYLLPRNVPLLHT
jgi:hypothetical protein